MKSRKSIIPFVLCVAFFVQVVFYFGLEYPKAAALTDYTVEITNNIKYGSVINYYGQMQDLYMDMYMPKEIKSTKKPAIVFIHGGGFARGDKQLALYIKMATEFAKKGYVAFSVNYHLYNQSPYAQVGEELRANAVLDIEKALAFIKSNSAIYAIDTAKIVAAGDSAGGAATVGLAFKNNCSNNIAFVIDLWGGMASYTNDYEGSQKYAWAGNIYKYPIPPNAPAVLIIHGDGDEVVPYKTSVDLQSRIQAVGVPCELYNIPGANHYPETAADTFIPKMISAANTGLSNIHKLGDIDKSGAISMVDALRVLKAASGKITLDYYERMAADVNKDGKISLVDALRILKFASGKITSF